MVKENTSNIWKEIDFDTFREELAKLEYESVFVDIKGMVKTMLTIENYQLIINNLHLIVSNKEELEICIDIDPTPKLMMKNDRNFKLDYDYDTEIHLHFFN